MTPLPIDSFLPEIVERVRASRALVLVAEPGAGKTTRVPPALLKAALLDSAHPNLVMLQPRRVAARAAAVRIGDENGWELGGEVGYHVRFDRKIGPQTRLRVLTEGILTRQLLDDPFIEDVGAVILDEFHERSLHTDVAIALLREVRQTVRDDLILIVMSATLDAEPVAAFLGKQGAPCPIVRVPGRTFPVGVSYDGRFSEKIPDRAADVVRRVIDHADDGDVLVFLPGAEEIRRTMQRLEGLGDLLVLPLHGSLPFEEQNRALRPARQRKVILATNIAETSLTIDGVTTVIDSGYARVADYDARRGLDRLELSRISKASATQRAGRAGRTGPGRCVRLWSEAEHRALDDFELPEIRRVDLASTVLTLHAWGKRDPRAFGWYESPAESTLVSAERLLAMLGALTSSENGDITPLGQRMSQLPVHPRLARLLIESAAAGMLNEGATIAALLSEKDILLRTTGRRETTSRGPSDVLIRLHLFEQAERDRFHVSLRDQGIDPVTARQVAKTRDELLRVSKRLTVSTRSASLDPLVLPLLAYPDRVCRRRGSDPAVATMVGGGGVKLAPESVVWDHEFFVALDARHDQRSTSREALVRIASGIDVEWLEQFFPDSIRREKTAMFDEQKQRVIGLHRVWYRDLLLEESSHVSIDPETASTHLAAALAPRALALFENDPDAARTLARIELLRRAMPEHAFPAFDAKELGEILADASAGRQSVNDILRQSLSTLLRSRLVYPFDRILDEHAPDAIAVPTGNRIRLDYSRGASPVLAVRLQELFGWTDTPRIAGGRVPVVLHLLGPNYRPVQITEDLRNFWNTTYFQVRKDLRARYPKHSWPEDPLTAKPEAKGSRRR